MPAAARKQKRPSSSPRDEAPPLLLTRERRLDLVRASAGDWLEAIRRAAALGIYEGGVGRKKVRTGREVAQDVARCWNVGHERHLREAYLAGRYHSEHIAKTRDERGAS